MYIFVLQCRDLNLFFLSNTLGAVWVKNLEQKINLRLKPPTDEEIVKLGGKSLEK